MMTSYRRNNGKRQARPALLIAVSGLAILIVLLDIVLGGRIRGLAQGGASAVWGAVGNATTALDQSGLFASRQSLAAENSALREKLAALQALQTANVALADENASLRALLNVPQANASHVTLGVLSSADSSPYGTIVLLGGSADHITQGAWVMAPGDVIIGTVSGVNARTSLVDIFLSPGASTPAFLASSTAITVTGRGAGNGIALVPRDTPASIGDVIYYRDHHSIVGIIGSIASSPSDAQKTLYLRVPFNMYGLHFVTVIPSPAS
jgi:cell shape-determining protein MreC